MANSIEYYIIHNPQKSCLIAVYLKTAFDSVIH